MQTIAIYGGTFDPIHKGHIETALNIQAVFQFDKIIFVPCKIPLLKSQATATVAKRVAMLRLALKDYPTFCIDLREIERLTPSYMVDTLHSFRTEFLDASITLILGEDAFFSLPQWHQWEMIPTLANLLIMKRPGIIKGVLTPLLEQLLQEKSTDLPTTITTTTSGKIITFDAGLYEIASSEIRKQIQTGRQLESYLPPAVIDFIQKEKLYI